METSKVIAPQSVGTNDRQIQTTTTKSGVGGMVEPSQNTRSTAGLFITPVIQFDSESLAVIFRIRDGLSGEVKQEYPQQSVIKGRQAVAEAAARRMESGGAEKVDNPSPVPTPRVEANSAGVEIRVGSGDGAQSASLDNSVAASTAGIADGLGNN